LKHTTPPQGGQQAAPSPASAGVGGHPNLSPHLSTVTGDGWPMGHHPFKGHLAAPIGCRHRLTMIWILGIIAFALGMTAVTIVMKNFTSEVAILHRKLSWWQSHYMDMEQDAAFKVRCNTNNIKDNARLLEQLFRHQEFDVNNHNELEVLVQQLVRNQDLISQVIADPTNTNNSS